MIDSNRNTWITLSVLAAALFVKSVYFRQMTDMDALSLVPLVAAYLSVAAVAVALAMVAWIPRRWPSVVLLVLTDLWLIAGIWYYAANNLWVNWAAVQTLTELKGFESSIIAYLAWSQLILPLSTLIALTAMYSLPLPHATKRHKWGATMIAATLYLGAVVGWLLCPLDEEAKNRAMKAEEKYLIRTHSPLWQIGRIGYEALLENHYKRNAKRPFTAREREIMDAVYRDSVAPSAPEGHLVYILVESLETWALEATDVQGKRIGAHLLHYAESHPTLYVPAVESQQKYGRSGDGQLITQTGLLPLSSGVACRQYGENVYPNLAHFYPFGVVLNPYRIPVWNQKVVTYSYGFKQLYSPQMLINLSDSVVIDRTIGRLRKANEPIMVLALTIDTHTPFHSHRDSAVFEDGKYSASETDYLRSVRYTDRQIGRFLSWADTASVMHDATIVITADHNQFPREKGHGLCPLIIRSPRITHAVRYEECLQMDIFPTVLNAIGQTDYRWKGFGIDLLDEQAAQQLKRRPISTKEAYSLSDKLIRTNYFAQ